MSQIAIKVENLSKIYRLGEIGTGTISRDLERWYKTKLLGKEDPFLKIGESNDRSKKGSSDIVYSLKDINFEIEQGDAVGIIGRNGAGKSTLLKILSRVTTPTTGKINIKGRVASLLEVGTGFHPELTGRENIYLNGAILGMRKKEIDRKLEEIIDFSGVERYIDTPVKRYSSGMYVRLAFAVAAHLESEILIVDEVLAVGDAEFQKKCLGKMSEVSKGEGRTVLFVSHNMAAVQNLCNKGIFLEKGNIISFGSSKSILELYADSFRNIAKSSIWQAPVIYPELSAQILNVKVEVINNGLSLLVNTKFITNKRFKKSFLAFDVKSIDETPIFQTIPIEDSFIEYSHNELVNLTEIDLPKLIPGIYSLSVWIGPYYTETHDWQKDCVFFEIIENPNGDRIMPHYKENGYLITTSKIIT